MASLTFHEDAADVVDKWLDLADLDERAPTAAAAIVSGNQRVGLGFQGKAPKGSDKMGAALKKNKKRNAEDEDEAILEDMHGVIDDLDESRIKAVVGKGKSPQPLPKKAKVDASSKSELAAPSSSKTILPASSADPSPAPFTTAVSDAPAPSKKNKPYRVKTRSKQKNIRRDNRPEPSRPGHLQLGARDYAGRPLTRETKAMLNIPDKPKKPFQGTKGGSGWVKGNTKQQQETKAPL